MYRDVAGVGYSHYDCDYSTWLMRAGPRLFGLPPARVVQLRCGEHGDDRCEFDVTWTTAERDGRRGLIPAAVASVSVIGARVLLGPDLILAGVGLAGLTGGVAGTRGVLGLRRRVAQLEDEIRDRDLDADAQLESLLALSSELRLDRALERITASAGNAINGASFELLIADASRMRARVSSALSPDALALLEQWAQRNRDRLRGGPIIVDSLAEVPSLRALAHDENAPLGSALAAPLIFREQLLGVLIGLAPGATAFLPDDARSLEVYASHAAIALWNARLVGKLEREAAEDPLTGLANRRVFSLACAAELDRAARHGNSVAMVYIDLDHFKRINDAHGHPFGDEMLKRTSSALRSVARAHDTVARIGGEEFALLLPGAGLAEGHDVAERARARIAEISLPGGGELSCSAGVAAAVAAHARGTDLMALADRALYEAKRQGRGRTVIVPAAGAGRASFEDWSGLGLAPGVALAP